MNVHAVRTHKVFDKCVPFIGKRTVGASQCRTVKGEISLFEFGDECVTHIFRTSHILVVFTQIVLCFYLRSCMER
jgi:hypothetical protein